MRKLEPSSDKNPTMIYCFWLIFKVHCSVRLVLIIVCLKEVHAIIFFLGIYKGDHFPKH